MITSSNRIFSKWKVYASLGIGVVGISISVLGLYWCLALLEKPSLLWVLFQEFFPILIKTLFMVIFACISGYCGSMMYILVFYFVLLSIGILLGIKSLKSPYRKIAILGIILCTINLIVALFTTYVWAWFLAR